MSLLTSLQNKFPNKPMIQLAGLAISVLMASLPAHAESLLIRNVRIISGDNPRVQNLQHVLIKDGRIEAIGKKMGRASRQLDAKGRFLIPGLIDTHVHLDGVPGYVGDNPKDAAMLREAREQIPRSYAYFGFTTVLDLTGDAEFIAKWNSQPLAPQAYFCAPVTIPNGYPAVYFEQAQFTMAGSKYMLFDPAQPGVYPATFRPEDHTPAAVVALAKQDGASCIKVFYETGFGPKKNLPTPSMALIQAVVAQARQRGLPVYLHANAQAAYEFAVQAGVDTLVHGMWHDRKSDDPVANRAALTQLAKAIAAAGITVQPTVQVIYGEQEELNPEFFSNPLVADAIPSALAQWYQSEAGQWMKNVLAANLAPASSPAQLYEAMKKAYQHPLGNVRRMTQLEQQAGVRFRFGSDTPSGPLYSQFPGVNGRWEMDRWMEMGFSLPTLFTAMTIDNARALGLATTLGSVRVGAQADLLLLEKNPLLSVDAYDTITHVILKGKAVERQVLSARRSAGTN